MKLIKNLRKHKVLCVWICLLLVIGVGAVIVFGENRFTIAVELCGQEEMSVEYGTQYEELGAKAVIRGTLFFKDGFSPNVTIQTEGVADTAKVGCYTISYQASICGLTGTANRTIHVVDSTAPDIKLDGDTEISLYVGDEYQEPGYSAWDACDGELTQAIQVIQSDDAIVYTVTDEAGNTATVQRSIVWNLPPTPRILLEGGNMVTIHAGEKFEDPGFTVAYDGDENLASEVIVCGEVNIYRAGTYELTYHVADWQGNKDSVVRTVVVSPVPQPEVVVPEGKVIYLTFDDGPSIYTPELLAVLEKYNVKATFFVVDTGNRHLIKDIVAGGHAIGIHSCTHKYRSIYASEEAYFNDILTMQRLIYEDTGVMTTLVRFPGGSSNTASVFNKGIMTRLTQALTDTGFQYFDWNVDSCDASDAHSSKQVRQYIIYGVQQQDVSVVLQHDTLLYSIQAVEEVIKWGLENGYTFLPLEPSSPIVHSKLRN